MPYRIAYSPVAQTHLRNLSARQRAIIADSVRIQLANEPTVETLNRKPMRPNPLARWALRMGELRVYYEVMDDPEPVVLIKAVGVKRGNKVFIQDQEVAL
ncbi:MAG: hypothetical protein HY532_09660 [Chloroflexi bacterium]|nr:hypothetical protein [Chloroflexota bacterium]